MKVLPSIDPSNCHRLTINANSGFAKISPLAPTSIFSPWSLTTFTSMLGEIRPTVSPSVLSVGPVADIEMHDSLMP